LKWNNDIILHSNIGKKFSVFHSWICHSSTDSLTVTEYSKSLFQPQFSGPISCCVCVIFGSLSTALTMASNLFQTLKENQKVNEDLDRAILAKSSVLKTKSNEVSGIEQQVLQVENKLFEMKIVSVNCLYIFDYFLILFHSDFSKHH
jgi:hypothetical protein